MVLVAFSFPKRDKSAMLRIAATCYLFFLRKEKVTEKKRPLRGA